MKLYEHQRQGLEDTKDLTHVAYFWDMGTGKTFVGSEKLMQLDARVNLIVCQKSKVQDWIDHFEEHYAGDCTGEGMVVFDLTDKTDLYCFIENAKIPEPHRVQQVGIINYDLVWRRPELANLIDFTLMLDESSLIQNETAKRTKFILKMHPKSVVLLSGTPTGGKYERLWSQMRLLGWEISKSLYWSTFVKVMYLDTMVGRSIPIVTGYKNVDRLKRKMHEYGCRFLKTEEVFDLPQQTFQKVRIPASTAYKKFRKHRIVTVDGKTLVGDTTLTKMLYERQLCGQYSKDKLKAFTDLVESTEDRLIVFYNFNEEWKRLGEICDAIGRPSGVVNGTFKHPEVLEKEGAILFVQYQAGAMGLNLQKANKIIYYSLPLSSEMYEQSKKRIHRIGQNRPCFYYQMIVTGSIEERILATLEMRKDYTEKLFEKENEK